MVEITTINGPQWTEEEIGTEGTILSSERTYGGRVVPLIGGLTLYFEKTKDGIKQVLFYLDENGSFQTDGWVFLIGDHPETVQNPNCCDIQVDEKGEMVLSGWIQASPVSPGSSFNMAFSPIEVQYSPKMEKGLRESFSWELLEILQVV